MRSSSTSATEDRVAALLDEAESIGGGLDGFRPPLVVLTFEAPLRFAAVETLMNSFVEREGEEWFYGNAYAEDGSPLNWWLPSD